jgi:hypothetical protein
MTQKITSETEIALAVVNQMADWEVYKEVPISSTSHAGSIDIFGCKGLVRMAVEAKLKIHLSVLEQAHRNRKYANFSYVAVPKPKTLDSFFLKICKDYGIGIFLIDGDGIVVERLKPKFFRKIGKLRLEPWMKDSEAGSLHGRKTFYSTTMANIEEQLKRHKGRININNLLSKSTYHWSNAESAKKCILDYIRKGIIANMRFEAGYLILLREPKKIEQ